MVGYLKKEALYMTGSSTTPCVSSFLNFDKFQFMTYSLSRYANKGIDSNLQR